MKDYADITWGGKMVADVVKARVWVVMTVDCFSVQSNILLELMSKVMFSTRIGPVMILDVFHLNANPTVAIGQYIPVNGFLIWF
jgi:hypothetical protein